jgi:hypothetical protein
MMAHKVTFSVPERPLANVDVEFNVRKNGTMLGTLKISQGGIVWRSSPASLGYFLSWHKFDQIAREQGRSRAL